MSHGVGLRFTANTFHPYAAAARGSKKKRIPINKSGQQQRAAQQRTNEQLAELSFVQRDEFLMEVDGAGPSGSHNAPDDDNNGFNPFHTLPPGEEGFLQSHAGGEAIFQKILSSVDLSTRNDYRTRKNRVAKVVEAWRKQMPLLVPAYLAWKYGGTQEAPTTPSLPDAEVNQPWPLHTISIDQRTERMFLNLPGTKNPNETLVRAGFLGAAPETPHLAFAFPVFELYRQFHRVCPRLSIQAFTKALDHLHHVPVHPSLPEQFSTAYDCYLELMREVDSLVNQAMGFSSEEWLAQRVCPPCLYKLDDEPKLKYSLLGAMDGNSSLKLFSSDFRRGEPQADDRKSKSERWLSPEFVDQFKDEVANAKKKTLASDDPSKVPESQPSSSKAPEPAPASSKAPKAPPAPSKGKAKEVVTAPSTNDKKGDNDKEDDDDDEGIRVDDFGSEGENGAAINTCVERWRNAGPEARKKMFALFAVSGIFVTVCRHGHLLLICDMIRSGELMKYPIAHVRALIDRYGADIGLGYDIFCQLMKTLLKSSLEGDIIVKSLDGVVPAFHGYAHNRPCQLSWHPLYKDGTGIEDFEECERTFSKSNELAGVTRLATSYHRHQQIDEHFQFHDADKYAASGTFIYENYVQALDRIHDDRTSLILLEREFTTTPDYEKVLKAEEAYLVGLKTEPDDRVSDMEYLELIMKEAELRSIADDAKKEHLRLDYNIIHNGYKTKEISRVKAHRTVTQKQWLAHFDNLCDYELQHSIAERWTPMSDKWQETLKYMGERTFQLALDKLERLFVQRMLEMTKLGMSGLGYKLREHIGKALKNRAEAIRTALNAYNKAAKQLDPPREELTWAKLMEIGSLSEFDLYRLSRADIGQLSWASPSVRAAMNLHFRVKRAKEERVRLNVEIQRLITYMLDVEADFKVAYTTQLVSNPPLAGDIKRRWMYITQINRNIAQSLARTSRLKGFTGSLFPGHHTGRHQDIDPDLPEWAETILGITIEYLPSTATATGSVHMSQQLDALPVGSSQEPGAGDINNESQHANESLEFVPRGIEVGADVVLDMLTNM